MAASGDVGGSVRRIVWYPLLWGHDQGQPIGLANIEDSDKALVIRGKIDRGDPGGSLAYDRAVKGLIKGLSIGFSLPNRDSVQHVDGVRNLTEVRIHEVSLVSVPAQPGAQILTVKNLSQAKQLIRNMEVAALESGHIDELRELNLEVKRLLARDDEQSEDGNLLAELKRLAEVLRPAM